MQETSLPFRRYGCRLDRDDLNQLATTGTSPKASLSVSAQRGITKFSGVICEDNHFWVVIGGETTAVAPRTTTSEVNRYKVNATQRATTRSLDDD